MRLRTWNPWTSWIVAMGTLLALAGPAAAARAVVLVRHAEKVDESTDAALSPAGRARAERLADLLQALGVTRIFVTEYQRTRDTAAPLARRLGLQPTAVPAQERAKLLADLRALRPDDVALCVGHSDTLPLLIKELGVKEPITIPGSDYTNVFLVVPRPGEPPALLRLKL